jgi:hypothetical protein
MGKILLIFCLLMVNLATAETSFYGSKRLGCSFEYPSNWSIDSIVSGRLIIHNEEVPNANIVISRYSIGADNQIRSEADLREAIEGLYKDIGVPESIYENIEYSVNEGIAEFAISYRLPYMESHGVIDKHVKGMVIQNTNGVQLFYLILAELPANLNSSVFHPFVNSFMITESMAPKLYIERSIVPYLQILLILALIVFFFARNRRIQKSRHPLGRDSSSYWRCNKCGKINHVEFNKCNRCGENRINRNALRK